jgi:hypothetical protein
MSQTTSPSPYDIYVLQYQYAQCQIERNVLVDEKLSCISEKEICVANSSANLLQAKTHSIEIDSLHEIQRTLLGVLITLAACSICINVCCLLSCLRRLKHVKKEETRHPNDIYAF